MVGQLNYSKWDNLELSDDSDIEVHPNIDKRSFIKWKQRDIHEKRDERKRQKESLRKEIQINQELAPRLTEILSNTENQGSSYYSREVARLSVGLQERGNKDGPEGPTSDDMILSLLLQINQESTVKGKQDSQLQQALVDQVKLHIQKLEDRQKQIKRHLEQMETEDAKKITSDNLREGWNSGHVNQAEPEPQVQDPPKSKKKSNTTVTEIETLNSASTASTSTAISNKANDNDNQSDGDDDDDEVPTLSNSMRQFANLPCAVPSSVPLSASSLPSSYNSSKHLNHDAFETALQFLSKHKDVLNEKNGTTDALLVEAFNSQMKGEATFARRCVEKALMIQYCNKLGKDGVTLFFRRMTQGDGKASIVYLNDVLQTYQRITQRCKVLASSSSSSGEALEEEQIQLVAEDESTVISFEIPDGPPPDVIELEDEAAKTMDPIQVKAFLHERWQIFNDFPIDFQEALKTKDLVKVNKVLGAMKVDDAELVVQRLDQAGILNFTSSKVRDETGKPAN